MEPKIVVLLFDRFSCYVALVPQKHYTLWPTQLQYTTVCSWVYRIQSVGRRHLFALLECWQTNFGIRAKTFLKRFGGGALWILTNRGGGWSWGILYLLYRNSCCNKFFIVLPVLFVFFLLSRFLFPDKRQLKSIGIHKIMHDFFEPWHNRDFHILWLVLLGSMVFLAVCWEPIERLAYPFIAINMAVGWTTYYIGITKICKLSI